MKHTFTGWECMVAHYENGRPVPQCQRCDVCREYVAWDHVHIENCTGKPKYTPGTIVKLDVRTGIETIVTGSLT